MSDQSIQQQSNSANTASFLTALWLNGAVFAAELVIFTAVRGRFKSIYEPRSFIPPEDKRMNPLPTGFLSWPVAVYNADWKRVLHQNGMDAYVFLRYLRLMLKIFIPIWAVSWAVLFPTTAVNSSVNSSGLNMFVFGNIGTGKDGTTNQTDRYAAHVVLAWLFTGYILYMIQREMRIFVLERQQFLVSPEHAASAQANTVLITGVPLRFLNEKALTKLFDYMPGGVAKIWINRDLKTLPNLYDQRLAACNKLESAELALLRTAVKIRRKQIKKGNLPKNSEQLEANDFNLADQLVPRKKRPTHRLKPGFLPFGLPFVGHKVDSIDWAKQEIARLTKELDEGRAVLKSEDLNRLTNGEASKKSLTYPPVNSTFVLFNNQIAAHMAAQSLTHHSPYQMASKYVETAPADVIWGNLNLNPYEIKVRLSISYAATAALIIFWAIPVAIVGTISAAVANCSVKELAWLCRLPNVVKGIIQGILPAVLLAVLNLLLPIILRLLARFEGIPRKTGLELSLMSRFFIFQVVHNFLIITLSASIFQTLQQLIKSPGEIPSLLAQGLPKGSTFFLTFIILQGLTGSAAGFLQIVPLVVYYAKLFILGSTPRSIYSIKYDLRDVAWGTLFPSITLITVISIAYMIISPVITGMAMAAFFLFYMMWKYLFLWQLDQPASGDTGGLFFPKAIQHTLVGLYLQQIVLAALMFFAKAVAQGAVVIVLILVTAFCHWVINNSFNPLLHSVPLTYARRGHSSHEESDDSEYLHDEGKTGIVREGRKPEDGGIAGPSVAVEGKRNEGATDFTHPAASEAQRIVWIPEDELGLAKSEVGDMREHGVEGSTENAILDGKGHTKVEGHPPGLIVE